MPRAQATSHFATCAALLAPSALVPPSRRPYDVAFVGQLHSAERAVMLAAFSDGAARRHGGEREGGSGKRLGGGRGRAWRHPLPLGRTHPRSLVPAYTSSRFVLQPRGGKSLNCLRLSEATMAGAVPVTVAAKSTADEASLAYYHGPLPHGRPRRANLSTLPWVIAGDWPAAADHVAQLLTRPEALDALQRRLLRWWRGLMHALRTQVRRALNQASAATVAC